VPIQQHVRAFRAESAQRHAEHAEDHALDEADACAEQPLADGGSKIQFVDRRIVSVSATIATTKTALQSMPAKASLTAARAVPMDIARATST
jgi:hypothetical protein